MRRCYAWRDSIRDVRGKNNVRTHPVFVPPLLLLLLNESKSSMCAFCFDGPCVSTLTFVECFVNIRRWLDANRLCFSLFLFLSRFSVGFFSFALFASFTYFAFASSPTINRWHTVKYGRKSPSPCLIHTDVDTLVTQNDECFWFIAQQRWTTTWPMSIGLRLGDKIKSPKPKMIYDWADWVRACVIYIL